MRPPPHPVISRIVAGCLALLLVGAAPAPGPECRALFSTGPQIFTHEYAPTVTITVTTGPANTTCDGSISIRTKDRTAEAGVDYVPVDMVVRLRTGFPVEIPIGVLQDDIAEDRETFAVLLGRHPTSAPNNILAQETLIVTVTDDVTADFYAYALHNRREALNETYGNFPQDNDAIYEALLRNSSAISTPVKGPPLTVLDAIAAIFAAAVVLAVRAKNRRTPDA